MNRTFVVVIFFLFEFINKLVSTTLRQCRNMNNVVTDIRLKACLAKDLVI